MGISELEASYSGVDFAVASEARFSPHITSFVTDTGGKVKFYYERYADPDPKTTKVVFIANTQDGRKIVVKFAEAHNEEAHSLLATEGFAPPLLYCDRPAFRDFTMVVMDYVDREHLFHKYPWAAPAGVLGGVPRALKTLHEKGSVFSDLRSPNLDVRVSSPPVINHERDVQILATSGSTSLDCWTGNLCSCHGLLYIIRYRLDRVDRKIVGFTVPLRFRLYVCICSIRF